MEFWLSRSLSHELFFFHDEIMAIKEPFTRTFLFSRWNSGYQGAFHMNFSFFTVEFWLSRAFHMNFSFFTRWNSGYQGPFIRTFLFSRWNSQNARFGGRLFSKSASLKTLPLDLEPPLQGKEYGPPYSNATKRKKAIVFFRNHL
jgi:hypothetical protein